jgi:hypothetical protein
LNDDMKNTSIAYTVREIAPHGAHRRQRRPGRFRGHPPAGRMQSCLPVHEHAGPVPGQPNPGVAAPVPTSSAASRIWSLPRPRPCAPAWWANHPGNRPAQATGITVVGLWNRGPFSPCPIRTRALNPARYWSWPGPRNSWRPTAIMWARMIRRNPGAGPHPGRRPGGQGRRQHPEGAGRGLPHRGKEPPAQRGRGKLHRRQRRRPSTLVKAGIERGPRCSSPPTTTT